MPVMNIKGVERRFSPIRTSSNDGSPVISSTCELRAEGEQLEKIVGYSAVFGVDTEIVTWFGSFTERIKKGAFRRAIREGQNVRALRNHDPDVLLGTTAGRTLRLKEDDTGLYIEVDPPNTTAGRDTVELIRRQDLSGMSFAFIVRSEKWITATDGGLDIRIIEDLDLYDVGPVTYPAYQQTSTDLRSVSAAYQVGLACLGKVVPPMPVESQESERSVGSPTSSFSELDSVSADSRSLGTELAPDEASPATLSESQIIVLRNRERLARSQLSLVQDQIKLLTK